MPIYPLLKNSPFEPEAIQRIAAAFEDTLAHLRLRDRADPLTELVAKRIIELAQRGERDPIRLRDRVLETLRTDES